MNGPLISPFGTPSWGSESGPSRYWESGLGGRDRGLLGRLGRGQGGRPDDPQTDDEREHSSHPTAPRPGLGPGVPAGDVPAGRGVVDLTVSGRRHPAAGKGPGGGPGARHQRKKRYGSSHSSGASR